MDANVGWQRILTYLRFLDATLLIRLIEPLEIRLKKRRGAPKLCLCDHALRAAWLLEVVPLAPAKLEAQPHLTDLAGHIAESTTGYFFRSIIGLDVAHFPERAIEPEVDYVITVGGNGFRWKSSTAAISPTKTPAACGQCSKKPSMAPASACW